MTECECNLLFSKKWPLDKFENCGCILAKVVPNIEKDCGIPSCLNLRNSGLLLM